MTTTTSSAGGGSSTLELNGQRDEQAPPPKEDLYRADYAPDFEVRAGEQGGDVLVGHFAKFNEWTEVRSIYEGHFMERIAPGAFTKTIQESANKVRVLFNHGKDVLGQQVLGSIQRLEEDQRGAYYEVGLFDSIPPLIRDGLRARQYGSSFRFRITRDDFNKQPGESEHNPNGLPERTVQEVHLREFGPVTFPAYPGATAGLRSLTDDMIIKRFLDEPDALRQLLLQYLPVDSEDDEQVSAPTDERAESSHPVVVRRDIRLFGLNREEKPSWQL